MMATSHVTDEDEVEFVSEGPLRPVLEFIDLLSDGENEDVPVHRTVEDQVDSQKAKVASTLDRLAHQVATQKQERAKKCKAFKDKVVSQQAHGRQELAVNGSSGETRQAKHCVDMWLKRPGPKPGTLHTGWKKRSCAPPPDGPQRPSTHTCPVVNCGRTFDSVPLLEGHLKRFDHSPCDPAVTLRGGPSEIYACVACTKSFKIKYFLTKESWRSHFKSKEHSSPGDGSGLSPQLIQCYACPCCCLLFNLRDQCLQHMAALNHFSHAIILTEKTPHAAMPIPVPRYAKNRLIALCKEVAFCVRCSSCRKILSSHMEARAHFSTQCRQAGAVAEAERTVPEVLQQLCAFGRCARCYQLLLSEADAEAHRRWTEHHVLAFPSVPEALLHYCHHHDHAQVKRQQGGGHGEPPAKRWRQGGGAETVWACECGLSFPEEAAARQHLLAANQVFHKCGVCGKEMGEASIARLHMSRFHGGAHLSNFLFRCRRCAVELPREEDILAHVQDAHTGHTFYREQEAAEKAPPAPGLPTPAEPLSPAKAATHAKPAAAAGPSGDGRRGRGWLCRMCEDVFDSEAAVRAHCEDLRAHSFQKFLCGECGHRFFKESTLARHCQLTHGGRSDPRRFCGLCDGMQHDSEEDFLRHYRSLHARDYCALEQEQEEEEDREEEAGPGEAGPSLADTPGQPAELLCSCMSAEEGGADQKAAFIRCMKRLAGQGLCTYTCPPCGISTSQYLLAKLHAQRQHASPGKHLRVLCGSCPESIASVPSFHSHFHARHCPLEPCASLRGRGRADASDGPTVLKAQDVSLEMKAVQFEEERRAEEAVRGEEEAGGGAAADSVECDEDLDRALALSAKEAQEQAEGERDMEEALQRSLLEF